MKGPFFRFHISFGKVNVGSALETVPTVQRGLVRGKWGGLVWVRLRLTNNSFSIAISKFSDFLSDSQYLMYVLPRLNLELPRRTLRFPVLNLVLPRFSLGFPVLGLVLPSKVILPRLTLRFPSIHGSIVKSKLVLPRL